MMPPCIMTLCLYTFFTWLCTFTGFVCDQCREGSTFTNAAITPNFQKTRLMRVPSARTMSECITACCNHSGCDLSWMLGRQCYIVNCQHKESCDPQKLDSMQSYLTFVLRPSPRFIPLPLYENFAPNQEYILGDQDEPKDDMASLKGLSSLIKSPPLEELTDYADDYVVPQMDFLHLNTKEGDKVRPDLDFISWLLPEVEKNTTTVEVGRRDDGAADHSKDELNNVFETSSEYHVTPTITEVGTVSEKLPTVLPSSLSLDKQVLSDVAEKNENHTMYPRTLENVEVTEYTTITESSFTKSSSLNSATKVPMQALTLSTAGNIEVTLPTDEVWLDVSVSPETQAGISDAFQWDLVKQPSDFQGELKMKNTKSPMLSKLTAGLYTLRVTVSREDVVEEGFVNVTVKPATRINQLPIAVVSPKTQEVSLPATSVYINGSQSTDDVKIVAYHWEEIRGSLQELKTLGDQPVLHLSDLVTGNYTFRLTVTDSDDSKASTEAYVIVTSPVDDVPIANAGLNQVITLPENHITLNGNLSSDDHQIVSYEWSLSPRSAGKAVKMQDVRSPYLEATGMEVGDYTFQLTVTDSSNQQSTSQVTVTVQQENNSPPLAETVPDKELTLPVKSLRLDGSKSRDDHGIVSYEWDKISGPTMVTIQDRDKPVAVVSDLQLGTYCFQLTVKDHQGLSSTAILSVNVKEGKNIPPNAYAGGKHVLVLPNNSISLDGSKSVDDQGIVSYQWTRDGQSPAAGDVMDSSDHKPVLQLISLVEGIYLFHLKVTDAKGESDTDTATVEVRPDARKQNLVELIFEVAVGQLSEQQKDTLVRRLAVLLNVLDSDIKVQKIQAHSDLSTIILFYVQSGQSFKIRKAAEVARTLQRQLLKEKADFLLYKVIRVDTAVCLLTCSGHGHCDPITKSCLCYPFWMENLIQRFISDGESNCEWSVLYISLFTFALVIFLMGLTWFCICYYKSRKRTKIRKKTKYTILDNFDEQERMALRPKYGIKHRSTEHNSSLMVSESEFDSEQDTIFSREKVDQEIPKNIGSGALKNGAPFNFSSKCR